MQPRSLVIFLGLAGFAGLAFALSRRPAADGLGAVEAPGEQGGDAWPEPFLDAAAYAEDSLGGVFMTQQRLSDSGLALLADVEGFSATPYADHKGYSIGYGHLIKPGEDLTYVTRDQAAQLLAEDVSIAERTVRTAVRVELRQSQFDALVSLAYNIGAGAFRGSTLVRKLNAGDVDGAAAEFARWNMASGQVLPALVARREREKTLFEA